MMDEFEKKLFSFADRPTPDSNTDEFLDHLHSTLQHRRKVKRQLFSIASLFIAGVLITVGLFQTAMEEEDFSQNGKEEFLFFTSFEDEDLSDIELPLDSEFIYDALEYLVDEVDPVGFHSDISYDLDLFGILNNSHITNKENQS